MSDLAQIVGAVLPAAAGGEAFRKSSPGTAIHLRVPKIVVAGTVHPISVPFAEVALTLAGGAVAWLVLWPNRAALIACGRSCLLPTFNAGFVRATPES